ncbi:unnamed protein product [Withania somnifera]
MERRSTFRFRLPWSQSAAEPESANKPSTQPNTRTGPNRTSTRQATRARTTSLPSSSNASKTSPSSSPNENSTPKQPPSAPTTATPGKPSSPAQSPPGTQGRNEVPATSPKTETQTPTTTITTTPTSTVSQRPQSSPPGVAPSRTESQPSVQSQEQQNITSQQASPSDVVTKSNASHPPSPSPSRPTPQSREMSPKSSPTRKGPQVLSTDQLTPKTSRPASQTSSNPFDITSEMQQKDQTISQPTRPPKQSQERSETSPNSTETLPSISEKEPTPTKVRPPSEQMKLLKKEAISDTSAETKNGSPKTSDSSRIISEPKTAGHLGTNIQETKVKEVVQETNDKNYAAGEKIGGPLTSKEQPDSVFQSKQAYTEKQANSDNDRIQVNRVSNGKQTRTISSQLKKRNVINDSSKETAVSTEPDIPLNKEVQDNISKFIHRMAVGDGRQTLEEGRVSVITLAGDNRGALMQLGSDSSRKGRAIQIQRGYKLNADESADATTDAEGKSEGRLPNDERTMKDQEIESYMNCNVQGLNNSITFDSSIEGKNPGIHMSFPRRNSETRRSIEGTGLSEAHKAKFNVNRAQKNPYEPKIRRRCLEGLFFEPSDSDSDNPEKPRRHGCRVGRMKKRDNDVDIL